MSEDDVVDPDSAVKALEDIAAALQEATEDEKRAFAAACAAEAKDLQQRSENVNMANFVRDLPSALGL